MPWFSGNPCVVAVLVTAILGVPAARANWLDLFAPSAACGWGGCRPSPPNPCTSAGCCQNAFKQCTIQLNQLPGTVDVPCRYGPSTMPFFSVSILNDTCGPQQYEYQQQVVSSSNTDFTPYAYVSASNGQILFQPFAPSEGITQTLAVTAIGLLSRVASQTIFLTFRFAPCPSETTTTTASTTTTESGTQLIIEGPISAVVCAGFPPGTDPSGQLYTPYSQLTFKVTNAPALLPLLWDYASDASPDGGLGAPNGYGVGHNLGIYSPSVLYGDEPNIFISNMNVLAGKDITDLVGIYGAGNNGSLPCGGTTNVFSGIGPDYVSLGGNCCQMLRFSVSPGVQVSSYRTGYKDVKVCYDNTDTCTQGIQGVINMNIEGPSSVSVCPGYPMSIDPTNFTRIFTVYPQLNFSITNSLPGLTYIWDIPTNLETLSQMYDRPIETIPVRGQGAPVGTNLGFNSPAVLSGDDPRVYISSMNAFLDRYSTTTAYYGPANNQDSSPSRASPCNGAANTVNVDPVTGEVSGSCCQILRVSVIAGTIQYSYGHGYKDVKVCYEDSATCTII